MMLHNDLLSEEEILFFKEKGYLVIKNVINKVEINEIKTSFHNYLKEEINCDINNLENTSINLTKLSSTNGAGGILDIFYSKWKLLINENPKIFSLISHLWKETYHKCEFPFIHPFGDFNYNYGYMYIDRVCFRIPDYINNLHNNNNNNNNNNEIKDKIKKNKKNKLLQRSLTPHLDCCPHNLYNNINKWRPIQMFLSLTDTLNINEGGFEVCPSLHSEFDDWIKRRPGSNNNNNNNNLSAPCVGSFSPIRPLEDNEIIKRMQHIPCEAGDIVCWDYRLPHANSRFNNSNNVREVIYLGFLPAIELNKLYTQKQLEKYYLGQVPTDQWHEHEKLQLCNYEFSNLGKKLMTINEWE